MGYYRLNIDRLWIIVENMFEFCLFMFFLDNDLLGFHKVLKRIFNKKKNLKKDFQSNIYMLFLMVRGRGGM